MRYCACFVGLGTVIIPPSSTNFFVMAEVGGPKLCSADRKVPHPYRLSSRKNRCRLPSTLDAECYTTKRQYNPMPHIEIIHTAWYSSSDVAEQCNTDKNAWKPNCSARAYAQDKSRICSGHRELYIMDRGEEAVMIGIRLQIEDADHQEKSIVCVPHIRASATWQAVALMPSCSGQSTRPDTRTPYHTPPVVGLSMPTIHFLVQEPPLVNETP